MILKAITSFTGRFMITLHLLDDYPNIESSEVRPAGDVFYNWLAWIRDLLDKDGAYVKISGRDSCLDLNHAGFWFLKDLHDTLEQLLNPECNIVTISFPRQGEEIEISHERIGNNMFHVRTYDGMTWKPNFGGPPYETKLIYDTVHSIDEIFFIYSKSFYLFIDRAKSVDDKAMHQPCMIAWQNGIENLLSQGLKKSNACSFTV
jgi:hypothetical protein